jgi:FlaG/FlaF family flagellin (archaellin)
MNNNTPTVSNQVSNQVASTTNPSTPINTSTSSTNNLQVSSNSLNNSIQQGGTNNNTNYDYQADDSSSSIQNRVTKGGWCFIGEDRGFRSCAEVSSSDYCMSGDIFPTNEVCINPSLRA